jgi:hypothetical protein
MLSAVFRNDPLYRAFYRLWQDIKLGIAAVFGNFLNLPLAPTFELYELWCFLRLVRAAAEEFGPAGVDIRDLFITDAAGGVTLAAGAVTVSVGADWKLFFQKQYRQFWIEPDRRGSYRSSRCSSGHPSESKNCNMCATCAMAFPAYGRMVKGRQLVAPSGLGHSPSQGRFSSSGSLAMLAAMRPTLASAVLHACARRWELE